MFEEKTSSCVREILCEVSAPVWKLNVCAVLMLYKPSLTAEAK